MIDRRIEESMGNLLRVAITAAAVVVLAGGVVYLFRHGSELPELRVFSGEPRDLRKVSGIVEDTMALHARSLIQLGLLMVIATPIARVALALVAFAIRRDRLYVTVSAIVLAVLAFSLAGGHL